MYDYDGGLPETFVKGEVADPPALPEFNKDEALPNQKEATLRADTGVHATLKTLSGHLQDLRSPDGSKMNPAKTCQDIKQCYPQKPSGEAALPPSASTSCCLHSLCCSVLQDSTGSIPTRAAPRTPSESSATWSWARPASLRTLQTSPTRPGGPSPAPAPTSLCGSELT